MAHLILPSHKYFLSVLKTEEGEVFRIGVTKRIDITRKRLRAGARTPRVNIETTDIVAECL